MDKYQFLLVAVLALLLNYIPYLGKVLRVVNTLFHESAHAVAALLGNGEVVRVNLFSDTSGAALTKSKFWLSKVLVSLAGYPVASFCGYALLWSLFRGYYPAVFISILVLAAIALVFWVRNAYGVIWLLCFMALLVYVFFYTSMQIQQYVLVVLAVIVMINSLATAFVLLVISLREPGGAGDATNLKSFTFVPAVCWALLFVAFAAWMAYKEVLLLIGFFG